MSMSNDGGGRGGSGGRLASLPREGAMRWVTKSERAYEALRQAIHSGVLGPNEPIAPKEVAADLGMSVIPVREALRRLEQDGLIVIKPHVGATVREFPLAELCENLLIRSELEALAARLATPLMNEEVLGELQLILERQAECIAGELFDQFGPLNREFHMTAYDVIAERGLIRLIDQQWDQVPRAGSGFSFVPRHAVASYEEHLVIFDALTRGDASAAGDLIREHKLKARETYAKAFEDVAANLKQETA